MAFIVTTKLKIFLYSLGQFKQNQFQNYNYVNKKYFKYKFHIKTTICKYVMVYVKI